MRLYSAHIHIYVIYVCVCVRAGTCNYAAGDDAKMLHVLTSTDNVTYNPLPLDWSVDSLLVEIANASPAFHALIDTGALVTGLTNLQVIL